ncbi:MAG: TonB family protein [Verrucomicrobia bacterium]|nr:TonB family protein [Verrucomicrobiota bacterium]
MSSHYPLAHSERITLSRRMLAGLAVSVAAHVSLFFLGGATPDFPPLQAAQEVPTIALDFPAPPPEEPELVELTDAPRPTELAELLAPPTQTDTPVAVIDSPFVQALQPAAPLGTATRTQLVSIPVGPPARPAGSGPGKIFSLSALDKIPQLKFKVPTEYPHEMRRSGLSGEVVVSFIVDRKGEVRSATIVSSTHFAFEAAALQAVTRWKFSPGIKNGVPVDTQVIQPVAFNLRS